MDKSKTELLNKYYKGNIERECEVTFIFEKLEDLIKNRDDKLKMLDVGFAGSWYVDEIIKNYKSTIDYTGLDSDRSRILGDSFKVNESFKLTWKDIIKNVSYVEGDIIAYNSAEKYDLAMCISTIEHIVPLGYSNSSEFDIYLDIKAIEKMKGLLKENGKILLTFPCGKEKLFFNPKNSNKDILKENGFVQSGHSLIIYDESRINKVIGEYKVLNKTFWTLADNSYKEDNKALVYNHTSSHVKTLCTLLIEKP
jgi:SAM-dependent methyltransferase